MPVFAQVDAAQAIEALRKLEVETLLFPVLVRLVVILLAARLCGLLVRRIGQPTVVGEILAGIVLGPSLLGWLCPDLFNLLFRPGFDGVSRELSEIVVDDIFKVLAQLGLILLMFLLGIEFDFTHLRDQFRPALAVCLVSLLVPFALSFAIAPFLHPLLEPHPTRGPVPLFGMTVFLGTALGIAALPVIGRILIEMGIHRTKLATTIITAAALGDLIGWFLLATVSSVVKAHFDPTLSLELFALSVLFGLAMLFLVRPLVVRLLNVSLARSGGSLEPLPFAGMLIVLFSAAIVTNQIGIFSIFGAFVFGMILSDQDRLREAVLAKLKDFVTVFFLPVFFTYTGLRTDLSQLSLTVHGPVFAILFVVTIVGKFGGCTLTARLLGFPWREAGVVGIVLNTLGLMGLIVINLGYDLGVIPRSLFGLLVVMALVTTALSSPGIVQFGRGTEIEHELKRSGYR